MGGEDNRPSISSGAVPLTVLVWENRNGTVNVSYNSPAFLAGRHHLEGHCVRPSTPLSRSSRHCSMH